MGRGKWNAREILSAQADCGHDAWCRWPNGEPCRRFSTDGTRLGADIAHTMGTTDERAIAAGRAPNADAFTPKFRSDVEAEQADWDAEDGEYDDERIWNHVCDYDGPGRCPNYPACQDSDPGPWYSV